MRDHVENHEQIYLISLIRFHALRLSVIDGFDHIIGLGEHRFDGGDSWGI